MGYRPLSTLDQDVNTNTAAHAPHSHCCRFVFFSIVVLGFSFLAGVALRRRRCEAGLRSSLLRQMQVLMRMLKRNMCPYLPAILDLAAQCWTVRTKFRGLRCRSNIQHLVTRTDQIDHDLNHLL